MGLRDNNKVHSTLVDSCGLQIWDLKIHIGFFFVQGWFTAKQKKGLVGGDGSYSITNFASQQHEWPL
jgi:hypothetical protein